MKNFYKLTVLVLIVIVSGCASVPNGQDILVEVNETQRLMRQIGRLDTVPDISILTIVGIIQKENAKRKGKE